MTVQTFLFDEIDAFKRGLQALKSPVSEDKSKELEDLSDEMLDLLISAYVYGVDDTNFLMGGNESPDLNEMRATIEMKIDGKDFRERIAEHLNEGDIGMIGTVADTDAMRAYNSAVLNTGEKLGATKKTWHTMEDEKVRDTHFPLDGVTVPKDAYFYTYDGDKALQPGLFEKAENNCGCRCFLEVSK